MCAPRISLLDSFETKSFWSAWRQLLKNNNGNSGPDPKICVYVTGIKIDELELNGMKKTSSGTLAKKGRRLEKVTLIEPYPADWINFQSFGRIAFLVSTDVQAWGKAGLRKSVRLDIWWWRARSQLFERKRADSQSSTWVAGSVSANPRIIGEIILKWNGTWFGRYLQMEKINL